MAGRVRNWFGKSAAQQQWDRILELRGVPPERARDVYERAGARLRYSPTWWAALLASTLVVAVALLSVIEGTQLFGRDSWFSWVRPAISGVSGGLAVALYFGITHRALRRFIRAELGTHCRGCDYDLRGTPDAVPPAVARCPECGRPIPRNVHRQTIGDGGAASDAADAALLQRQDEG